MVTEDIQLWICHYGFIFSLSVSVFKKTLQSADWINLLKEIRSHQSPYTKTYGSEAEPWTAYNRYTYVVKISTGIGLNVADIKATAAHNIVRPPSRTKHHCKRCDLPRKRASKINLAWI